MDRRASAVKFRHGRAVLREGLQEVPITGVFLFDIFSVFSCNVEV